jgi:hypothetical protein
MLANQTVIFGLAPAERSRVNAIGSSRLWVMADC